MFQKRDVRFVQGVRLDATWSKLWDWWARQGFQLAQSGPYQMHGTSIYSRIGLRREIWLVATDAPGGANLDLSLNAQITDEGLVAGAVSAVLLFPIAVVGGALSYSNYETDAQNLIMAFWQFANSLGTPSGGSAMPTAPAPPAPCTGCGAGLLPDWKVCPYCGRARSA